MITLFSSCNDVSEKEIPKHEIKEKSNITISKKTYKIEAITVSLTQSKSDGKDFYCKAKMVIQKNKLVVDSVEFMPQPVGGDYGISKGIKLENHLIFTKHGDYDGRTLIINSSGKLFDKIGGINYYDSTSSLLFSIYESDLSGFSIFDLETDSTIFEMEEIEDQPYSIHKDFGNRYFIYCYNRNEDPGEPEIIVWEIELELDRIMQVDLDTTQINESNILTKLGGEDVFCVCE